ncbi:MAG: sulfatase-like hydrolase/transferase, partial [Oscillospiraceae bacterium]
PSRACLMTGRYGHRFGYECNLSDQTNGLPISEETIGDIFKANGYRTAAIGKWHLGSKDEYHPNRRGFDLFYGMKAGHRDYFYDENKSDRLGDERNILRNDKPVKFDKYLTDTFSDEAARFIKKGDQPFMLYLAYNAVHTPMQATKEDLERFKEHPRQKLAAMTFALDRGIGVIVNALKESGKFDNTLIFFLSDNGGATNNQSSNTPLKGFKGNKFEGGHRIPYFLVWKNGISHGHHHYSGLVSSLDIFATATEAAGISQTRNKLDGTSLLPYINNKKKGEPHEVLYWRKMDTRAIRSGDYKLIITQGVDSVLYNIQTDPGEMKNLIKKEVKTYRRLAKRLTNWEKDECITPLWVEKGWSSITNGYHQQLMHNKIKSAQDLKKKK